MYNISLLEQFGAAGTINFTRIARLQSRLAADVQKFQSGKSLLLVDPFLKPKLEALNNAQRCVLWPKNCAASSTRFSRSNWFTRNDYTGKYGSFRRDLTHASKFWSCVYACSHC